MAFSYDPALSLPLDRVRHAIGDTDEAAPLREDETIDALITAVGEEGAIAALAEALAAEYAQAPDSLSSSGKSISWRERVKTWLELASRATTRQQLAAASATDGVLAGLRPVRSDRPQADAEYVRPTSLGWDDAIWTR